MANVDGDTISGATSAVTGRASAASAATAQIAIITSNATSTWRRELE